MVSGKLISHSCPKQLPNSHKQLSVCFAGPGNGRINASYLGEPMISVLTQFAKRIFTSARMLVVVMPYVGMAVKANGDTVLCRIISPLLNRNYVMQLDFCSAEAVAYTTTATTPNQGFPNHYICKCQGYLPCQTQRS